MPRPCNRCSKPTESRVEVRITGADVYRVVVCGSCAVALATSSFLSGAKCIVLPFAMPRQSCFVAGDLYYSPNVCDVEARQRKLELSARAFCDRVRGVIARTLAAQPRVA